MSVVCQEVKHTIVINIRHKLIMSHKLLCRILLCAYDLCNTLSRLALHNVNRNLASWTIHGTFRNRFYKDILLLHTFN